MYNHWLVLDEINMPLLLCCFPHPLIYVSSYFQWLESSSRKEKFISGSRSKKAQPQFPKATSDDFKMMWLLRGWADTVRMTHYLSYRYWVDDLALVVNSKGPSQTYYLLLLFIAEPDGWVVSFDTFHKYLLFEKSHSATTVKGDGTKQRFRTVRIFSLELIASFP